MQAPSIEKLRQIFQDKGYRWNESGQFAINIIGVRSDTSESNKFDDFMIVAAKDKNYQWVVRVYPITTDPGKPWLLKPMDPGGCAVMVPGQYIDAYMVGIHGRSKPADRRYEALEQCGKIRYVRDNNRDSRIDRELYQDPKKIFSSIIKTNIHRASRWTIGRFIETYSAGCQVFQKYADFEEFMKICKLAMPYNRNRFTYTLLEERDLR
jgi:hypothetical protein